MSLAAWFQGYRQYLLLERNLSQNSIAAYLRDIKRLDHFLSETSVRIPVSKIDESYLREFVKRLSLSGCSPVSQSRILSGIRSFFEYLILERVIDENPAALIDFPRWTRKLPTVISDEEVGEMFAQLDVSKTGGFRNKVMLELLYACGMRVSELINLRKGDISFEEEWILVTGKGNKQRKIPVSDHALHLVKIYIETERNQIQAEGVDREILFLNRRGKRLTRVFVYTLMKELAQRAGMNKKVGPHALRHSFATELVSNGADLRAVQSMLGHESITTTEIYAHLDRGYLKKVVDEFHPRSRNNRKSKKDDDPI